SQAVLQKRQAGRGDHDRTAQGAQEAHRDHALAAAHRAPEGRAARSGQPQGLMAPEYAFLTHWRLKATAKEVYDILADPTGLARWWPSVYLDVKELAPPDPATGQGRVIGLYTKEFLPYTLRWNFTVTGARRDWPGAAPARSQDGSRAPGDSGPARLDLQVKLPLVGVAFALEK